MKMPAELLRETMTAMVHKSINKICQPKSSQSEIEFLQQKNPSVIRPGRITVRTPPSDGKMGTLI